MHDVQEMASIIARLNLHFPRSGGLTNQQLVGLAEDWAEDLAEFPMPVIRQAVKLCRRDERRRFFPSLGELVEYCRVAEVEYRRFAQKHLPAPSEATLDADAERNRLHGIDRLHDLYGKMGWRMPAQEQPKRPAPSVQAVVQNTTVQLSPEQEAERAKLVALRAQRKRGA